MNNEFSDLYPYKVRISSVFVPSPSLPYLCPVAGACIVSLSRYWKCWSGILGALKEGNVFHGNLCLPNEDKLSSQLWVNFMIAIRGHVNLVNWTFF